MTKRPAVGVWLQGSVKTQKGWPQEAILLLDPQPRMAG